jgi:hypothetical protein
MIANGELDAAALVVENLGTWTNSHARPYGSAWGLNMQLAERQPYQHESLCLC